MPFVHQNLKQEGRVTACWRAQGDLGNNNKNTLTEIFNSDETKELRRAVLNNERPEGCRSCWDAEDSGVDSTRLQTLTNWDVVDNQLSFTDGETPKEGSAALEQCVLEQVEDDYSFPIRNLKSIDELPKSLNDYINFLEKELNIPIVIVSVGPDRKETLFR